MQGRKDPEKIAEGIRLILEGIGEDVGRDGLVETPSRVSDFWLELTEGYDKEPADLLTILPGEGHDEVVIVRGIEFASMCEHHLAPFIGVCDLAYLPGDEGIVGISKLGRLVDLFAKRLQVQERLTSQIADALFTQAKAEGVIVRLRATHTCMTMRGVKKVGSETITIGKRGVFVEDIARATELLAQL